MIKSIKAILAQDKEKFKVPRKVQDLIPIKNIWPDGIFKVGNKFSKSFRFSDINYLVASREDKESMFLTYSELLNSLDSGAATKITINNHRLNRSDFEESILMPMKQDGLDEYRKEYNDMLLDKATGANGITQEKYITITVAKKDIEEARAYFVRIGADLTAHFANLGSKCVPLNAAERLRILHDFYRPGDEAAFSFDMKIIEQDSAKTKSSLRTLPLVGSFRDYFQKVKEAQELNKKVCGNCYNYEYDGYVFVNELGERMRPNYLTEYFPKYIAKHGMPKMRFHDLRHSCASLLLANGVPLKQIQEWLGHSDFSTTANIYAHLDYRSKISSAQAMEQGMLLPRSDDFGSRWENVTEQGKITEPDLNPVFD